MKCALLAVAWPLHVSAVLLAKRPREMQDLVSRCGANRAVLDGKEDA